MRRKAFVLALLGTTCLTPVEAKAEPVSAFVAGFAASFGATATTAATASAIGGAAAAGFSFGTFLAGPIGSIILSVGLSAVASLLTPQPSIAQQKPSARMVNYAQPVTYQERVYGRVRKGGPLAFTNFVSGARYYAVILAAHSISSIVEHWLDERLVELVPGTSTVATDPPGDRVFIRTKLGQPGQTADSVLVNTFPEWTAAHDMAGLAYGAINAVRCDPEDFSEVYPTGREPAYNPVIDGNDRIFDPRTGTYGYTNNAALIIAHELVEYQDREVHWPDVATEADVCDEQVITLGQGLVGKWRINGVISDNQEWEEIRSQFMAACDAFFYERTDGKIGFYVGRWMEPDVTLTEADFIALDISEGVDMGAANEFVVQYTEPRNQYRETPSGVWIHDPGGRRTREEISAFMVGYHNQAARVAKRWARSKLARYSLSGTLKLSGYNLIGKRFAWFRHSEMDMEFPVEIGKLVWNGDRITFGLEAVSTAPEDFAFVAANEEPKRPLYNGVVSSDIIPNATGLVATAVQSTGGSAAIDWSWPAQPTGYLQQLRYRRTTDAEWQYEMAQSGQTTIRTTGLIDGATYEGQLRNRTGAGRSSEWKPDAPETITAIANQTAPGALSNFAATGGAGEATVSFDAPNDAVYFATRIYRSATTVFADAALVRAEYGIPSNADSWTDTSLSPGTYHYWGEPINSSGIPGPLAGPDEATVT